MSHSLTRRGFVLGTLLALLSCSGCAWLRPKPQLEPTPIQFQQTPSLEQLATAVNGNTDRVVTLQTRDARITLKGIPVSITADMTFEQPRRFRFRAGTGWTGQELDLGSNDELFWFWARQNPQPALLFARHDDFARSPNRNMLPIEPLWIIDAMGLPKFDPAFRHEGPLPVGQNNASYLPFIPQGAESVLIRSYLPSSSGEMRRDTIVHTQYAWVLEQTVYNARGEVVVSAKASNHEYFPRAQVALPRKVEISVPAAQLAFTVETNSYSVNLPLEDPQLFVLPRDQFASTPLVDLADPRFAPPGSAAPENDPYSAPPNYPPTTSLPRRRGLQ